MEGLPTINGKMRTFDIYLFFVFLCCILHVDIYIYTPKKIFAIYIIYISRLTYLMFGLIL